MSSAKPLYILPTHESERLRLDKQHRSITLTCGGLYIPRDLVDNVLASNTSPAILDVGTGSGIWAEEMARAFPQADVTGVDIVAPTPTERTPSNCRFRVEDANNGFGLYDQRYAVVHMRMIGHGIRDFREVIHNAAEVIRPGGVLLLGDFVMDSCGPEKDLLQEGTTALQKIVGAYNIAAKHTAMDARFYWDKWLQEMPLYKNAGSEMFYVPVGPWMTESAPHAEAGTLFRESLKEILPTISKLVVADGKYGGETVNQWLATANREVDEMTPKVSIRYRCSWAIRSEIEWEPRSTAV